jgi:hypothetical protein
MPIKNKLPFSGRPEELSSEVFINGFKDGDIFYYLDGNYYINYKKVVPWDKFNVKKFVFSKEDVVRMGSGKMWVRENGKWNEIGFPKLIVTSGSSVPTGSPEPTGSAYVLDDIWNDDFENARTIIYIGCGIPLKITGSSVDSTFQVSEPYTVYDYITTGATVWWKWNTPSNLSVGTQVSLDLRSSSFDTQLAVFSGSSLGSLTRVAENDDYDFDNGIYQSYLTFTPEPSSLYYIKVDGYTDGGVTETGDIVMDMMVHCPPTIFGCEYYIDAEQYSINTGFVQGFAELDYSDATWLENNEGTTGPAYQTTTLDMSDDGKYVLVTGPTSDPSIESGFVIQKTGTGSTFTTFLPDMTEVGKITGFRRQYTYVATDDPKYGQISRSGSFVSGIILSGSMSSTPNGSACWLDGYSNPPVINSDANYYRYISDSGLYTLGVSGSSVIRVDLFGGSSSIISNAYLPAAYNFCMSKVIAYTSLGGNTSASVFQYNEDNTWTNIGRLVYNNNGVNDSNVRVGAMCGIGKFVCGDDGGVNPIPFLWDLTVPPTGGIFLPTFNLPSSSIQSSSYYGTGASAIDISSDGTVVTGHFSVSGEGCFWSHSDNFGTCNPIRSYVNNTISASSISVEQNQDVINQSGSYEIYGIPVTSVSGSHFVAKGRKYGTTPNSTYSFTYITPTVAMKDY